MPNPLLDTKSIEEKSVASRPGASQVLAMIEKFEKFIDASEFMPASRRYRGNVLLALISKALTVGRAVCAVVQAGFPAEAFGMSRTLVEIFLTVRYIANKDVEERARTYVRYFAKTHEGWTNIIEKHFPEKKKMPMPNFHDEAMEISKQYKNRHAWTGMRGQTKLMALEEDAYEVNEKGEPVKQDFDYEVIYWWTSHYVHGTILSLAAHEMEPGGVFHIRARMGEDTERGHDALFNTLIFLSKIFVCALRGMNEERPEELLNETLELAKLYAKAKAQGPDTRGRRSI
jgi:hypothetical protein